MMKILLLVAPVMLTFGLGCNHSSVLPVLNINQIEMSENSLYIECQVKNKSSGPIWLCEDVSIYLPFDEICEIEESTIYINRKVSAFPGPDKVFFDQAMIGKYVYIKPGQTKNCFIEVLLFDKFTSFVEYTDTPSLFGVNNVILSVGYFDLALCETYLEIQHLNPEQSYLPYELQRFVRESHEDTEIPEYLYVPNCWEGIKNEKTLDFISSVICHHSGNKPLTP